MSSTNKRNKQPSENSMKEGSSKVSSPSSPNSRQARGEESSRSQSPISLSKPKNSQLRYTKDMTSRDDGRQNSNASYSASSKAIGKRTPQTKDINIPLAQSFRGDHKEGSGSSGATSAGSRSTGKDSGSEIPISDPGSTGPTTPTISPRGNQVNSSGRVSASASTDSTPESVTRAMSRLSSGNRILSSSNATEKTPIIYSANKLELSAIKNLNIYRIGFFPNTPPREQCRAFIQSLHEEPNLPCLSKGYASDYSSSLLTIGDIPDTTKKPLILPMPCSGIDYEGTAKPPRCYLLISRITSIPVERVLDYVLSRSIVSLQGALIGTNLQALSILLPRRYQDSIYTYRSKNHSKFYPSSVSPLVCEKQGLKLTRGYVMNISNGKEQLNLQARSCTAVFYPEMALSQLIETFSIPKYDTEGIKILENLLVGLQVRITYDKARKDKVKTIKSIGRLPREIKFVEKEGNGSTDVKAHFEHRWGLKIKKPQLPAVNLGSLEDAKVSDDTNRASKPSNAQGNGKTNKIKAVYVPPELCIVMPNQLRRGELSDEQKQIITTFATHSLKVDINRTIRNGLNRFGSPSKLPKSRVFDLQNRQNQIAVSNRIREPPMLIYEKTIGNAGKSPNSLSAINNALVTRKSARNWSMLRFNGGESSVATIESNAIKLFQQALQDCGWTMKSTTPKEFTLADSSAVTMAEALRQAKDLGVAILLVVLPDRKTTKQENLARSGGHSNSNRNTKNLNQGSDHPNVGLDPVDYATLKRIADTEIGIHTVCLKVANLTKDMNALDEKKIPQNWANIALKFNLKCGLVNKIIDNRDNSLKDSSTMIVGIHITPKMDPSPKESNKLSKKNKRRANQGKLPTKPGPPPKCMKDAPRIVGMVANSNHTLGQWPGSLCSQASDIDRPQDLGSMITERLKNWQVENNNSLPTSILVYRSGATEGQYESIMREEFNSIKSACAQIYARQSPEPKLSMIIVTKIHNSGFAAIEGDSRLGTFVEKDLAKAEEDFALQASIPILQNEKQPKSKAQEPKTGTPNIEGPKKAAPTHTRPTHYVVVRDETESGIEVLETITHELCYVVGTTNEPVSVCAPIHYARLLCEHSKSYAYETYNQDWAPDNSNRAVFKDDPKMLSKIYHKMELKDTMFYV